MIYGLATSRLAPQTLGKLNSRKVPVNALFFSCIFLLAGVVLLYAGQSIIEAFTIVTTISALLFIFIWSIILASYLQYRRKRPDLHEKSTFKLPGGRASVVILWALAQEQDTAAALKVTPIWFVFLGIVYLAIRKKRQQS
jgi:D-serine/D-alanine/glycine transporter